MAAKKKTVQEAREVLAGDHARARTFAQEAGDKAALKLLTAAQKDLEKGIRQAEGLRGPGKDSFTAAQKRATLRQVTSVLQRLQRGMKDAVVEHGTKAAEEGAEGTARYLATADAAFRGVGTQPLALKTARMLAAARGGSEASILRRLAGDDEHPAQGGILQRYGMDVVGHFEQQLQKGLVARKSLEEMRQDITERSPFLQEAPAFWGRRIVRTELAGALNRGHWEGIRAAHAQLGDCVKILSAVFDDRTAADSYATHGQIRRPDEAFETWYGLMQHPPDRSNDRGIVVPHRLVWPIPPYLEWKTDEEVFQRWQLEQPKKSKVKREMPERPLMTTIPLSRFGASSSESSDSQEGNDPSEDRSDAPGSDDERVPDDS